MSHYLDYLGMILLFAVIIEHRIYWDKMTVILKSPVIPEKLF